MRYKDSEVYGVRNGDIWQVGDNHTFYCTDVVQSRAFGRAVGKAKPDLIYSDPPWSDGQVKQYRTLSKLPPVGYGWQGITAAILKIATTVGPPLWIVHDRYTVDLVKGLLPWPVYGQARLEKFGSASVIAYLHYSGDRPAVIPSEVRVLHDSKVPLALLRANYMSGSNGLIVDPCHGLGSVSRCAAQFGWRSLTNEVSPQRVSAALRKLEKLTGDKPVRVAANVA